MLKNDLETRRISRMGSLITPPRCADGGIAISPASRWSPARVQALNKRLWRRAIPPACRPTVRRCFYLLQTEPISRVMPFLRHIIAYRAPRPVQAAPFRKPLGIGLRKRAVGLEGLDAVWRGADGV